MDNQLNIVIKPDKKSFQDLEKHLLEIEKRTTDLIESTKKLGVDVTRSFNKVTAGTHNLNTAFKASDMNIKTVVEAMIVLEKQVSQVANAQVDYRFELGKDITIQNKLKKQYDKVSDILKEMTLKYHLLESAHDALIGKMTKLDKKTRLSAEETKFLKAQYTELAWASELVAEKTDKMTNSFTESGPKAKATADATEKTKKKVAGLTKETKEATKEVKFMDSAFVKFGVTMSGIAATMFVFQQVFTTIKNLADIAIKFETDFTKVAYSFNITTKEAEKLEKTTRKMASSTGYAIEDITKSMGALLEEGYSVDKTIKLLGKTLAIAANDAIDFKKAAKLADQDLGGLESSLLSVDKAIKNTTDYRIKTITNALKEMVMSFEEGFSESRSRRLGSFTDDVESLANAFKTLGKWTSIFFTLFNLGWGMLPINFLKSYMTDKINETTDQFKTAIDFVKKKTDSIGITGPDANIDRQYTYERYAPWKYEDQQSELNYIPNPVIKSSKIENPTKKISETSKLLAEYIAKISSLFDEDKPKGKDPIIDNQNEFVISVHDRIKALDFLEKKKTNAFGKTKAQVNEEIALSNVLHSAYDQNAMSEVQIALTKFESIDEIQKNYKEKHEIQLGKDIVLWKQQSAATKEIETKKFDDMLKIFDEGSEKEIVMTKEKNKRLLELDNAYITKGALADKKFKKQATARDNLQKAAQDKAFQESTSDRLKLLSSFTKKAMKTSKPYFDLQRKQLDEEYVLKTNKLKLALGDYEEFNEAKVEIDEWYNEKHYEIMLDEGNENSVFGGFRSGLYKMKGVYKEWGEHMETITMDTGDSMRSTLKDHFITKFNGDMWDFESAWNSFWDRLKDKVIDSVADMVANTIIDKGGDLLLDIGVNLLTGLFKGGGGYDFGGDYLPFDTGAYNVKKDSPAYLHEDEMVLTANISNALRAAISGGGTKNDIADPLSQGLANIGLGSDSEAVDGILSAMFGAGKTSATQVAMFGLQNQDVDFSSLMQAGTQFTSMNMLGAMFNETMAKAIDRPNDFTSKIGSLLSSAALGIFGGAPGAIVGMSGGAAIGGKFFHEAMDMLGLSDNINSIKDTLANSGLAKSLAANAAKVSAFKDSITDTIASIFGLDGSMNKITSYFENYTGPNNIGYGTDPHMAGFMEEMIGKSNFDSLFGGIGSIGSMFGGGIFGGLSGDGGGGGYGDFGGGYGEGVSGSFGGVYAKGGPTRMGKTYLVGEEGPELFMPNQNGYVYSNKDSQSMASDISSGAKAVEQHIHIEVDGREIAHVIASEISNGNFELINRLRGI